MAFSRNDTACHSSVMILLLTTTLAFGQLATSDILGTVTDSTGAEVPNATVTIRNLGTNDTRYKQIKW